MSDLKKTEYFRFLFRKTLNNLTRYELNHSDKKLINNLFKRLLVSENILKDLFILSHVKELNNMGKYFIFILKKIDDNVINFDNFTQNIETDSYFIEEEILQYFSNPEIRQIQDYSYPDEDSEENSGFDKYNAEKFNNSETETDFNENEISSTDEDIFKAKDESEFFSNFTVNFKKDEIETGNETDDEVIAIRKNYLELIQSDNIDEEIVFELPKLNPGKDSIENSDENSDTEFQINFNINENLNETEDDTKGKTDEKLQKKNESPFDLPDSDEDNPVKKEEISGNSETENTIENTTENIIESEDEVPIEDNNSKEDNTESSFVIKGKLYFDDFANTKEEVTDELKNESEEETFKDEIKETEKTIKLSKEIQEELDLFKDAPDRFDDDATAVEDIEIIQITELEPTNAAFTEFEDEIKIRNDELDKEFDIMIYLVNAKPGDEYERNLLIESIIEKSASLEIISRKMSLEIISNIYQTITLSFEKIADGKYDISEGTLNLFKKGLILVTSLIKGDDYFGYKDILKSIENIRNSLLEEKEKREKYLKRLQEKKEMENQLNKRFPDDNQKKKLNQMKHFIKDTEARLNSLYKIAGEYQIYEALRSLSGNLNNFKEIVILSNELDMKKMGQLSEASYIFLKFLQNYRINPATDESKEIFGYIIHNMKSIIMNKPVEDLDLFISYLNDPVKIFSKKNKEKS